MDEIQALRENRLDPVLTEAEHQDLMAQLLLLLRRAAAGTIQFAKRGEGGGEAEVMKHSLVVIELKPQPSPQSEPEPEPEPETALSDPAATAGSEDGEAEGSWGRRRPKRHLRFYYCEPADVPDLLLGLHLAMKADGLPGLAEQNLAIAEAERRAEDWALQQV